jgi:chromosome segregation ATPase
MKAKKIVNPTSLKLRGARKIIKPKVDPSFVELFEEHDNKMQRYMGALSEDFKHQLSGVAEGVTMLGEQVNRLETKVDNLETNMNSKFKTVFDYLSRIDDELQDIKKEMERLSLTKADKTEIKELSHRVSNLEKELAEVRRSVKV